MELYLKKLRDSYNRQQNNICLGWDPDPDRLPMLANGRQMALVDFLLTVCEILRSCQYQPAAFKPNPGFFCRFDEPLQGRFDGSRVLGLLINRLRTLWPANPLVFDFKRGDIGHSSANYAVEAFEVWQADAATVHPYLGSDSLAPFAAYNATGHCSYVLLHTSNPGAADLQDLSCNYRDDATPEPLYLRLLNLVCDWGDYGLVVGATWPEQLAKVAGSSAGQQAPLLIPGVGSQGGDLTAVCQLLQSAGYPLYRSRINLSRSLLQPWPAQAPFGWEKLVQRAVEHHCRQAAKFFQAA